jgi:flagellar basal-body rod protein FlgB
VGVNILGSLSERALERAIDAAALRHETISENLANIDTPGYKRGEVRFEETLAQVIGDLDAPGVMLARTQSGHLAAGGVQSVDRALPEKYRVTDTRGRVDGNNVDVDSEMTKLAQNSLLYNSLMQVLGKRISMVRSAINEGRR